MELNVREFTVPATVTIPPDQNMTDRIFDNASRHGDDIAFARKVSGRWQNITAKEFASDVRQVAAGLIAYRITYGVDDAENALGQLPEPAPDHRRRWHEDLRRGVRELRR